MHMDTLLRVIIIHGLTLKVILEIKYIKLCSNARDKVQLKLRFIHLSMSKHSEQVAKYSNEYDSDSMVLYPWHFSAQCRIISSIQTHIPGKQHNLQKMKFSFLPPSNPFQN